ncbi:MAG: hypothetical protein IJZ77_06300 [Bacilli bacterium]|nr:hypothetical protein [Bacilli bacterium]MBQ8473193.1 hypothetical protein [Bacilli bacterium]
MTEIFNKIIYTFGSTSALKAIVSYEKKREGANMLYRFNYKILITNKSGEDYGYGSYANNLQAVFTLNGVNVWTQNTKSSDTSWSFEYTSEWLTVKNKTTGTVPFKFTIKDTQNSSWCNYTSGTYSLGVDPAGSDIGAVANFNIGNAITVPITKYASMYDVLVVKMGSTFIKTINNASSPTTITFTSSELNTIYGLTTTVQSTVFTFELTTYEDSSKATIVGTTKSTTARGYIVGSYPLINSITAIDTNSTTTTLTGNSSKIVRYKSNVKISVSVSPVNQATIKSVTINGKTATLSSGYYVATFNSVNTNSFDVKVIDSRDFPTDKNLTISSSNYIQYIPLTLSASVRRNQPTDGKVVIEFSGNYFNGSFGSVSNTLTVQYRYIQKGGSWVNTWNSLTPTISGNTYKGSLTIEGFDYQKQYVFQVRATDKFGTPSPTEVNVTKGQPILWWNETDVTATNNMIVGQNLNVEKNIYNGIQFSKNFLEDFRSQLFNKTGRFKAFKVIRSAVTGNSDFPQYSAGMAWAIEDTQGFILTKYGSEDVIVGGGNGDVIKWIKHLAFKNDLDSYQLQETVLYNNTTGTTGTITLSQSSANFTYLEFFYNKEIDGKKMFSSTKVYQPNGKYVALDLSAYWDDSSTMQTLSKCVYISGTSIGVQTANTAHGNVTNGGTFAGLENQVYITRIVGYK